MSDYYIRAPERDESRGPFDVSKLLTLTEAGQITPNTLYYDEEKEEWIPLALNEELKAQVFPERERLEMKIQKEGEEEEDAAERANADPGGLNVESISVAAEGDTEEKRKLTHQKKSFERAATISAIGLGFMMIFSALFMILPLITIIQGAISEQQFSSIFNYPRSSSAHSI